MSRILAAYSAGGLIGPLLGATGGVGGPFLAYLLLVLAAIPLAFLLGTPAQPRRFRTDRAALRLPGFWLACAGITVAILALGLSEGVLPLHFASRLGQAQLGALYVGAAVVVAASSALAGSMVPTWALAAAGVLVVAGIGLAGAATSVALFVLGLGLAGAGAGIGLGQTGATGVLLAAVAPERIVTAMVLWSQLGIVGYLAGPLLGGTVAQALGFRALGLVPLAGAVLLLATARKAAEPADGA